MKSIFFFIVTILFSAGTFAQENKQKNDSMISQSPKDSSAHANSISANTHEAEFPGGGAEWVAYISRNLDSGVPVTRGATAGTYEVTVRFVIDTSGNIKNIKAETWFGFGMEKELIRVIKKAPKWIPAIKNGVHVNAYRRQSATFFISNQ